MEELYFREDIKKRYRIKDDKTAVRIMRIMGAQGRGKSLFVRESQIIDYEMAMTTKPERVPKKRRVEPRKGTPRTIEEMLVQRI